MKRYLENQIKKDLQKKMVFLGGPRQVGKTTLARSIEKKFAYYNWDIPEQRRQIQKRTFAAENLLIFDELHKFKSWRNYLKGLFDELRDTHRILVTGSAKLDVLRRGGDSLQGRYHFLRLHPLSFKEVGGKTSEDLRALFDLGGFPEPFLQGEKVEADRWTRDYGHRFLRDEVMSVQNLQDLGNLEILYDRLPDLVGSPLSLNGLREDLQVSHHTIRRWLDIFEVFYGFFRLAPFGAPKIRAVKKEQKHYHYDWNLVRDPGARFENLIACHLLKWCQFFEDTEGRDLELRYFRDVHLREVDFVVLERRKPVLFVECKLSDGEISKGLVYLHERFPQVKAMQISLNGKKDYRTSSGIRVCPAIDFLETLV